jgi:endoglycosylceramidase
MPILSLKSFSQDIPSYGMVSYNSGSEWLRTNGKWIVDGKGNIIILRGANFLGYGWGNWKSHTLEDYERMKSWGFNVVRLPIGWNYIEPEPGVYNESYLAIIDRDISWAKQAGLYIVLDMHQWRWSSYFTFSAGKRNGMPVWLVSGYNNSADGMAQAITDFWLGKAPNGTEPSEGNPSMQNRFIAMWKYVAIRYANEATIVAYDLFNEPPRGEILPAPEIAGYLYSFYDRLISEIRKVDKNHIIIYEPMPGKAGVRVAQLLNFSNIVFSFHFYDFSETYSGNVTDLENAFLTYHWELPSEKPIKDWGIPIWIGEFGSSSEMWARDTVKIFEKYKVGWAWWGYYKSDRMSNVLLYSNGTEREHLTQFLKQT